MEGILRLDIYNSNASVFWRHRGYMRKFEHISAVFVVNGGQESALAVCTPWVSLTSNGPYIYIGSIVNIHDPAQVICIYGGQIQPLAVRSICAFPCEVLIELKLDGCVGQLQVTRYKLPIALQYCPIGQNKFYCCGNLPSFATIPAVLVARAAVNPWSKYVPLHFQHRGPVQRESV